MNFKNIVWFIKAIIMIVIIIIIIIIIITTTTTTIIKIYVAQIPCEYVQMHVTNKYDRN